MPGAKKSLPAPIDRPLSRAYLRQFLGWSTAYPPGMSQPNSLRFMENVIVSRDTGIRIRPGMRHLTYMQDPLLEDGGPLIPWTTDIFGGTHIVGTHEVFFYQYEDESDPDPTDPPSAPIKRTQVAKAYLFAAWGQVEDGPDTKDVVKFYVARYTGNPATPFQVFDAEDVFDMNPLEVFFSRDTTYVKYVQIDNKILALSNAGEPFLVFHVGTTPTAYAPEPLPGDVNSIGNLEVPNVFPADYTWIVGSQAIITGAGTPLLTSATLMGDPASLNLFKFAVWVTYSNEIGESEASQVAQVGLQRPWSGWVMQTPDFETEPSGVPVTDPHGSCDQLLVAVDEDGYAANINAGATKLNVYMATWGDDAPQPVEGVLVESKDIVGKDYAHGGFVAITPGIPLYSRNSPVPNELNRRNYSIPSRASQGLVAADRLVLVNDPVEPAVIRWTSNQQGEYLNFSANRGGGYKTLTSGNLYVTSTVKLWQNPQSVDSLTILCDGVDGMSTGYYMAPAEVTSQSESTAVMGFEETTATPGTVSPYGTEVFNNALYHPIDEQLMKSTAANYAIRHKSLSDLIAHNWTDLVDKDKIVSAEYDGRIYYIVHNPDGAALETGCNGNEIWVLDAQVETPTWNRLMIQAVSLRKVEVGGQVMMSVVRPEGIFALDPAFIQDEYLEADEDLDGIIRVFERAIPWRLETNTQGANRAHDSWVRLQLLEINLGNFKGRIEWGIRYLTDVNGKAKTTKKITNDQNGDDLLPWHRADFLQIRRDLKEWYFFANSVTVDGEVQQSSGQINTVQYRYTPNSVNTGYEFGSVETFEYGRAVANGNAGEITTDGVPVPMVDMGHYNPVTDGPDA